MPPEKARVPVSAALEREHQLIDAGLEAFLIDLRDGRVDAVGLSAALEGLRKHIYLEERILFPPIRQADMAMPVAVMMTEHGEIWRTMDALVGLLPDGDTAALMAVSRLLLDQLAVHNSKEEQVIYRAADSRLEPHHVAAVTEFIESGLLPDSWECLEAD